jgi:uncharacterized protein YcfL
MQTRNYWIFAALIVAALMLTGCTQTATPAAAQPVTLEPIGDTELNRVILTERALQRLDIQTAPVSEAQVDGKTRAVVPYAALLYDLHGENWIYTNPEPLVFVRQAVKVERIDGDSAVLAEGPPVGTAVVTVGVAELYGADTGVGK